MASKASKKKELPSSKTPSVLSSVAASDKKCRFPIWPEWNEADINAEKWDAGKAGKEKPGKGQISPGFDDPDGKIKLPASLKVHSWKRPQEFLTKEVRNKQEYMSLTVLVGKLMRWIVSEIYAVWRISNENSLNSETPTLVWKPWEHIYALCKATDDHMPLYNKFGKYVLKLYWMGCWRKIIVDDTMPFSEEENLLLPATTCQKELWPMLLSKAIIKLANTRPEYLDKVWGLLKEIVPEFKFPERKAPELEITQDDTKTEESRDSELKSVGSSVSKLPDTTETAETANNVSKGTHCPERFSLTGNGFKLEIFKNCLDAILCHVLVEQGGQSRLDHCDSVKLYCAVDTKEGRNAIQKDLDKLENWTRDNLMGFRKSKCKADSSEKMRQYGLSHIHNHPVLITRTRSCPLVAPPEPPPPLPPWKLFRLKKQVVVTSEPQEPVVEKPEKYVEIASLFFKYKLDIIKIPTDICFPQSILKKGFKPISRLTTVTETDENESGSNGDMNQNGRHSNAEDYSKETIPLLQQNAEVPSKEKPDNISIDTKQISKRADTGKKSKTGTKSKDETASENISVSRETWITFEDFCICFQNLYVFHKPHTYAYNYQKTSFTSSDEEVFYYLLVDSLMPIEILVSFSALVRWNVTEGAKEECPTGVLRVEYFSWKSVTPGELVLKMRTSATKATVVNLPVGRHILLFTVICPIGHHIQLCTMVPCVFGEEDAVIPALQKESSRFIEQATTILRAVGNVINNYSSKDELPKALKELEVAYCPPGLHDSKTAEENRKAFNNAFWCLIKYVLDKKDLYRYKFAFRSFTLDFKDTDISGDDTVFSAEKTVNAYIVKKMRVNGDSSSNRTSSFVDVTHSSNPSESSEEKSLSSCENQTPTSEEEAAALKIQAIWRGTYIRKILKSREPGTKENTDVEETLENLWTMIELNFEQCAVTLLRLHVLDNDTQEEIPHVFFKVTPHVFPKNKKGYTFVAEAHTGDQAVAGGKWKLRFISSHSALPVLSRAAVNNAFSTLQFKEYYIPNKEFLLFRYFVKVRAPHTATLQVQTSNSDVLIKLQVLDNEKEITSIIGKGNAVIPVFNFWSNQSLLSSQ
ncbi:Androglobin [Lonchura striata]|uniref:Androglobin n=1 Tax=Lonchura striata TaxID=40157 RepID=A0A218VAY9_9PASE|nr:Androglobin [Lonchura striata domestica]